MKKIIVTLFLILQKLLVLFYDFHTRNNDEVRIFDQEEFSHELSLVVDSPIESYEDVRVTHNIRVLGLRMLYTLLIEYLIYHHFIEIFNLEEYKKSDYLQFNISSNYDPFSNSKKYEKNKPTKNRLMLEKLSFKQNESQPAGPSSLSGEELPNIK
jgi:hypothetical protein